MTDKQIVQFLAFSCFRHSIGKGGIDHCKVQVTFYVGPNESYTKEFRKAVRADKKRLKGLKP